MIRRLLHSRSLHSAWKAVGDATGKVTRPFGGPLVFLAILVIQSVLVGLMAVDPRISLAFIIGFSVFFVALEWPILGVALLIVVRLFSTSAIDLFRVGSIGIGPLEPVVLLCAFALIFNATMHGKRLFQRWPWLVSWLAFVGWMVLGLFWSVDRTDGLKDILPMIIVLANSVVIISFVTRIEQFRYALWAWVGGCLLIAVTVSVTSTLGIEVVENIFQAADKGGRQTGLGQQPNWFAMNLMFIIHTSFGMALVEKKTYLRIFLVFAGFFIFYTMLTAGSRGSFYAVIIGGIVVALAHPVFRKWFVVFAIATLLLFGVGLVFNLGAASTAMGRITSSTTLGSNFRYLNWLTCLQMFRDTHGIGIGTGGYKTLLYDYNGYVAESLYNYPHGIIWQILANFGVIGILIWSWMMVAIAGMVLKLTRMTSGTNTNIIAWSMPASMVGYGAWSFFEFTVGEKPFWEFLALYTALYLIIKRITDEGGQVPNWPTDPAEPPRALALDHPPNRTLTQVKHPRPV